ncbi:unnamed protein product, partial [Rotaria sp. Silwood2]
CQHLPFQCIRVLRRGINKCITNWNHLTTVGDIIHVLLEQQSLTINDCCLYIENSPHLFVLKSTDLIEDILYRYPSSNIHFKLAFKRNSSPSRFAQRKQLLPAVVQLSTVINPFKQLRIQELLIQKQQGIIHRLTKVNDHQPFVPSTNTRRSRQDEFEQGVNRESNRSLSRVRFRLSTINRKHDILATLPPSSIPEVKSILKKAAIPRTSSVDRDIDQLLALKQEEYRSDASDDDHLSDQSTTDSCLGSLSTNDSVYHSITQTHLETLV